MRLDEIKELAKNGVAFVNPLDKASIRNILPDGSEIIVMCNSETYHKEMEHVRIRTVEILNNK